MNPVTELTRAWRGWAEIVAGYETAGQNFTPGLRGLAVAILWFLIAGLLSSAIQSMAGGMPGAGDIVFGLFAHALTLAALALAISRSLRFLKLDVPVTALLVPIIYARALIFVVTIPLTLAGSGLGLIALLGLVPLIWRAGQVIAGMRLSVAVAFALLCLMVLVVVPIALYMVFLQFPSPA